MMTNPEADPVISPPSHAFFQAVGIVPCHVNIDGDKLFVTIGDKRYGLFYASTHKRAFDALRKEVEVTGVSQQRLIVYPRVTHFPGGKQPYRISFQLVGFMGHGSIGEGISSQLEDFEFRLSGLWQFIPVCRIPCVSIFKNFDQQRLDYIKAAPVDKKVGFMKASHIPVQWRDSTFQPFRFNPKLDKEQQGKALFIQIKAKFNSERDTFEFVALLGMPTDTPPKFLKAGKKDKAEVAKEKLAARKAQQKKSPAIPTTHKPDSAQPKPKPKPKPRQMKAGT